MGVTKLPVIPHDIQIGRGALFFRPTGSAGAWRFGESSGFSLTIEAEKFIYDSNQTGLSENVKTITTKVTRTGEITCDNMSKKVREAFLSAITTTVTQASGTVTNEVVGPLVAGEMFRLGSPAIAFGARKISAVTVAASGVDFAISTVYTAGQIVLNPTPTAHIYVVTAGGTSAGSLPTFPTVIGNTVTSGTVTIKNIGLTSDWVADTDYSYDEDFGNFNVNYTGRVASAIALAVAAGGTLIVKVGYTRAAANTEQTATNSDAVTLSGELIFREEDPVNGVNGRSEWLFPKVTLSAGGGLEFITSEAKSAVFAVDVQ